MTMIRKLVVAAGVMAALLGVAGTLPMTHNTPQAAQCRCMTHNNPQQ
jgi:hypothetical protein